MRDIAPEEYYHLYNRGVRKQTIFHDRHDWSRFLFLILFLQSPKVFLNITRPTKEFVRHSMFNINPDDINGIISKRYVELTTFTLMPNHFHLVAKEVEEGGISTYMQRVLNGYTKYYNAKYHKSGHLFQSSYRSIHIKDNTQLLHTSAYIHRNPRELKKWKDMEAEYEWSSYQDFIKENRWGDLLAQDIILEQFKNRYEYAKFVNTSLTKLTEEELSSYEIV